MVIIVLDHIPQCYTPADGAVIHALLNPAISRNQQVTLSFAGVADVPSSFINAALIPLVQTYGMDKVKTHLRITNVTSQVADMIRRCFVNAGRMMEAA